MYLACSRHALHAHELRFAWNGEELTFTAPLPEDMRELMERFPSLTKLQYR